MNELLRWKFPSLEGSKPKIDVGRTPAYFGASVASKYPESATSVPKSKARTRSGVFRVTRDRAGNRGPLPAIFPDMMAPIGE
jgi:hypothetical protein